MKYGFIATAGSVEQILQLAEETEAAGWDGFFYWDGISIGDSLVFDPWVILGAAALRTSRVTLGAIIFPLARRRPWKVARESITVDHLSSGRLVIPVGLGVLDDGAFSRVNGEVTDKRERAARLDETLDILERAWSGETFSYEGTHYQVKDLIFRPRPVQQPRIPIWTVAAYPSAKSMGRAARYDGVLPAPRNSGPPGADSPSYGPDFIREVKSWLDAHRTATTPYDIVVEGTTPIGDPAAAAAKAAAYAEAGATWWIESMWEGWDQDTIHDSLLARVRQGPPKTA